MDKSPKPTEEADSSNPFEIEEVEIKESAAPEETVGSPGVPEGGDSGTTLETAVTEKPPEVMAEDPWKETEVITSPEPSKLPLLIIGLVFILALAAIGMLVLRNRSLQGDLQQSQSHGAELQAQLDRALQPVGSLKSPGVRIVSAIYGSGVHWVDASDRVAVLLRQPDAEFFSRPEWLKADPTPGWNKELMITYEYHGARHLFLSGEGDKVSVELLEDAVK